MNILFVYCHPEPTSFTHALLQAGVEAAQAAGHDVEVSDLYSEGFNPAAGRHDFTQTADEQRFHYQTEQLHAARNDGFAADIRREQDRVRRADMMVFLFPLWWGGMPAMLKGWFDRVLAYGFAYVDGARFDTGLLIGRAAMMCVSTGGTAERFSAGGVYGTIEQVLWPAMRCQLDYLGVTQPDPFIAYAAPRMDDAGRQAILQDWQSQFAASIAEFERSRPPRKDLPMPDLNRDWTSQ